jgi:hypothetical protein
MGLVREHRDLAGNATESKTTDLKNIHPSSKVQQLSSMCSKAVEKARKVVNKKARELKQRMLWRRVMSL